MVQRSEREESTGSAEFCARIPAVAQHILGGRPIPGFGGKGVVVWERSSAELRGKEVAKGCVGTKWHRVGWRQSGAQFGGSEVVQSSV